ncbi:HAD-IB family hydrolase [Spiractinospora alimapuensis]|uniref:HAD family hydrolase n=1 Tax=Spiractinospora alimapuensis TaxID=2820884 RepID=UPI001F3DFCD0|nr:HAD-IB family hydrolase [Spiractinospora alimapuensis]QVQ50625.1 HAD-IB family hydrolase [Spiractinospora alimapuensis]
MGGFTPHRPDGRSAAFFDVDNTLMRGAAIYHLARGLAARDLVTTRDLMRFAWGQLLFRASGTERRESIQAAREAALGFVAGHTAENLQAICAEIYDETMADRVWEETLSLVRRHQNAGDPVWLVTATPVELADVIRERLGLAGALGTIAERDHGVYTGRLVGDLLHGQAKAHAVVRLADTEDFDLSRCTAYSDSSNDLPLLRSVGYPNAVNPDRALRRHATRLGWPVHEFRTTRTALRTVVPAAVLGVAAGAAAQAWRARGGQGH